MKPLPTLKPLVPLTTDSHSAYRAAHRTSEVQRLRQYLDVESVREIDHGQQYRLSCGLVMNIYSTGTIMVQGRLPPGIRDSVLSALKIRLPANTRWQVR